jgi:hypothetical protein
MNHTTVVVLDTIEPREAFGALARRPRLIALMSPT